MTQLTIPEAHRHIVSAAFQAWGHARPLCALVARIVKARPLVTITYFAPEVLYDRMEKELSRHFNDDETDVRARIRLIALKTNREDFMDTELLMTSFAHAYAELAEERPVTCIKTSHEFSPIRKPDAAILDVFANTMLHAVRKHSANPIKIYGWMSCSLPALHCFWGPSGANKDRNVLKLVQEEAERSGEPLSSAAHKVILPTQGKLVKTPGISPMYDYELHCAQEMLFEGDIVAIIHMAGAEVVNGCDGMIMGTPECFEPQETIRDLQQWFGKMSQELFLVGPVLPNTSHAHAVEKKQSSKSQEMDDFMNRVLATHGPRSLLYVSFGSIFWPTNPEKVWAFVDVLIERKVPFIFSHASPFAKIPEEIQDKVKNSDLGLLSPWSPQQAILAHPVTGWFVTHCGFNSIIESVASGVPMICWPYQGDQPANAAVLVEVHDVAYELLEVRTGLGLKPLYRTGLAPVGTTEAVKAEANRILDQAFGDDGKRKRANVERLCASFSTAWSEDGSSRRELERVLDSI